LNRYTRMRAKLTKIILKPKPTTDTFDASVTVRYIQVSLYYIYIPIIICRNIYWDAKNVFHAASWRRISMTDKSELSTVYIYIYLSYVYIIFKLVWIILYIYYYYYRYVLWEGLDSASRARHLDADLFQFAFQPGNSFPGVSDVWLEQIGIIFCTYITGARTDYNTAKAHETIVRT